jgi:hypothetical protein
VFKGCKTFGYATSQNACIVFFFTLFLKKNFFGCLAGKNLHFLNVDFYKANIVFRQVSFFKKLTCLVFQDMRCIQGGQVLKPDLEKKIVFFRGVFI